MLQHISRNSKYIAPSLLVLLLVTEAVVDYEGILSAVNRKQEETVYRSSGIVDKLFGHTVYARYENIVKENIFVAESKRRNEDAAVAVKTDKSAKVPEIRGITITPDEKIILMWSTVQNKSIVVREGESVDNWTVISINKDVVTVRNASGAEYAVLVNKTEDDKRDKQ